MNKEYASLAPFCAYCLFYMPDTSTGGFDLIGIYLTEEDADEALTSLLEKVVAAKHEEDKLYDAALGAPHVSDKWSEWINFRKNNLHSSSVLRFSPNRDDYEIQSHNVGELILT